MKCFTPIVAAARAAKRAVATAAPRVARPRRVAALAPAAGAAVRSAAQVALLCVAASLPAIPAGVAPAPSGGGAAPPAAASGPAIAGPAASQGAGFAAGAGSSLASSVSGGGGGLGAGGASAEGLPPGPDPLPRSWWEPSLPMFSDSPEGPAPQAIAAGPNAVPDGEDGPGARPFPIWPVPVPGALALLLPALVALGALRALRRRGPLSP